MSDLHQQQQHACPYCRQRFNSFSTVVDHLHRNECHQVYTRPPPPQNERDGFVSSPHNSASHLLEAVGQQILNARGSTAWGSTFAPTMLEQIWLPQLCADANSSSAYCNAGSAAGGDKARPRSLTCGQCGAVLSNVGNLNRHIRAVHIDIRPFKCERCEWAFHRRSELDSHVMRVHFVVKPHRCQWCEKSYTRKEHLQRHVRSDHSPAKRKRRTRK